MCPSPQLHRQFFTSPSARPLLIMALLLGSLASTTPARAEVSYDLGLYSAYVWRGISFTDGAVFQPSVTTSHQSGFRVNVWGNLDIDDDNDLSGDFQEIDLALSYAFGKGPMTYEMGLIEYIFPNSGGPGTREAYFAVGLDAPSPRPSPSTTTSTRWTTSTRPSELSTPANSATSGAPP